MPSIIKEWRVPESGRGKHTGVGWSERARKQAADMQCCRSQLLAVDQSLQRVARLRLVFSIRRRTAMAACLASIFPVLLIFLHHMAISVSAHHPPTGPPPHGSLNLFYRTHASPHRRGPVVLSFVARWSLVQILGSAVDLRELRLHCYGAGKSSPLQ
jgi:hypothetical protein